MNDILEVIQAIGQQWPFLIVLFIITVIIIKWNSVGEYITNISNIKLKKGENEVSISRKIHGSQESSENDATSSKMDKNIEFFKRISKAEASQIFFNKLGDPNIKNIKIITYTNEVEAGQINHYKVSGEKTIEVYKRSVLADLYEQQKNNIKRLQSGKPFKPWQKDKLIIESTEQLENEFSTDSNVKIIHYFYDYPPTKRAYIFNDSEAIYSYYQCLETKDGSIYKGMGDLDRFWISNHSDIGKYLIGELLNEVKILKIHSRNYAYEKLLIENGLNAIYSGLITPVMKLKAVFIDMDGILYDSLWQYKIAWHDAFKMKGIEISDYDVYMQEGRSGIKTINLLYWNYKNSIPIDSDVVEILEKRNEILQQYGKPKPQFGVYDLLAEIKRNKLDIYLVTGSSNTKLKDFILEDFSEYINPENIIYGKEVRIGKPSPEPYLLALHKASLKPTEAIVIENAPLGIESSKSAGIFTIAVNTGILGDVELLNAGSDIIFSTCADLAKNWNQILKYIGE